MTTSGTYTFSVSRDDIIRNALLAIRKLDEVEGPTAQDTADCSRWLNMMVKQWQGTADFAPGLKTWTRRRGHLFLSNSTGEYSVGSAATGWTESYDTTTTSAAAASGQAVIVVTSATGLVAADKIGIELTSGALFWGVISTVVSSTVTLTSNLTGAVSSGARVFAYTTTAQQPLKIEAAALRSIDGEDVPVYIYPNVSDYESLTNKVDPTNIGHPGAIYYEFQLGNSKLFTDVAAADDVTRHLVLTYMESIQDFSSASDTPEYPQEWYLPLSLGLAKLIAPIYGTVWSPANQENYAAALAIAQRKDPEVVTMYFQSGE